jgi:hypothetical protein
MLFRRNRKPITDAIAAIEERNPLKWTNEDALFDCSYDPSRVLYHNDFETSIGEWVTRTPDPEHFDYGKYEVKAELTDKEFRFGSHCMAVTGRQVSWNGASLDVTKYLKPDIHKYEVMVWVKLPASAKPCRVRIMSETRSRLGEMEIPYFTSLNDYCEHRGVLSKYKLPVGCGPDDWDTRYPPNHSTETGWVLLRGTQEIRVKQNESVFIYIETNNEENTELNEEVDLNDIYIDDFVFLKGI